ncbi:DUF397 domain-containing protein [Streptomyces xantholiticus]|uniref:DUF397 domain-containing protein n=1 Tax=Streptomyces xantholiticus TaxID=68285 RepID=UPI001673204D|nr:DUF397 domain-containing protein [Streptomyces xantholiticus]GGW58654.1 hypothetical protein GCM10010381_49740 [Streptomyces xantholiticus]
MNTEQQLHWFKSSYSGGEGGSCIEIADGRGTVHVRDSKRLTGPRLAVRASVWADFVAFTGAAPTR